MRELTDLSIIIVSWNVCALLEACLESIVCASTADYAIQIIVVDSASSDGSDQMIREKYPQVKLLAQPVNLGYTRCNNIGLDVATGRYMLLLNPDTEIIGDALAKMTAYMEANPAVGVIGPHTLNSDGTTQSTRRHFPTLAVGLFESTWLQPYAPRAILNHHYVNDGADDAIGDVDWVQGSALMVRRETYTQIGGLDEGYTMYSEELDWCKRTKDAGWRVVYYGQAQITHHGGKSSEQVTARKHIHFQESKLRYFRKYHGWASAQVLRLFLLISYVGQIIIEGGKSVLGHKRAMRQERIRTYWAVLRSGLKVS